LSDDGNLRVLFREHLRVGFHWQSIETGAIGVGTPDSNFCCAGVERWVEYKQTEGWACTLRTEQIGWHVRRHMVGGVSFVATRRWHDGGPRRGAAVDELWLHLGRWARELKVGGLRGADPLAVYTGGPSQWDWDDIRRRLTDDYRD
jgi:hypothetical protein